MMIKRFLIPVVAFVAIGLPASASITTYCAGNQSNCTDSVVSHFSNVSGPVYTVDLTALQGPDGNGCLQDPISVMLLCDYPNQSSAFISQSGGTVTDTKLGIQIQLPANTLVFAFNLHLPGGQTSAPYSISGSGIQSVSLSNTLLNPSDFFFGVVSSTALSSIIVQGPINTGVQINGVKLPGTGGGSQTPEVATLFLIGFGLLSMRWMKRWPRRVFHTPRTA